MSFHSACRVYMRARNTSEEEIPTPVGRKPFRKKRSKIPRVSEVTQQDYYTQDPTFPCSTCNREIDIPGTFHHKKRHVALATLGVQWDGIKRLGSSEIILQRKLIIAKLLSSSTLTEKHLHSINSAFELLWKKELPEYYKICESSPGNSSYTENISTLLIKGVAICADRNSTWKADMNDKVTVVNNFGSKPNVCFFSLFAGHKGASAADLASTELPVLLLHQLSRIDPSYQMTLEEQNLINSFGTVFKEHYTATEDFFTKKVIKAPPAGEYESIHKAFAKAFWRMDRLLRLGRKEVSRVQWSGCSAVTCILEDKTKNPTVKRSWKKSIDNRGLFKRTSQILSGVLHIANTGNVEAVLCRNGKGFCLTKDHTTRNTSERRRVLQSGATISSNEPHGLLEGQIKTTRGLGFHGNPRLKRFIIPAPQTISVPIDILCQFLILATSGLWEVMDTKEVTALAMTTFEVYKSSYYSIIESKYLPSENFLLSPANKPNIIEPENNIHLLFQSKSESKESLTTLYSKELPDTKYSKHFIDNPGKTETFQPETTNYALYTGKEADGPTSMDAAPKDSSKEKESFTERFYKSAAEYISCELVNAALAAGSRNNITVMVILLSGSEYQLLT